MKGANVLNRKNLLISLVCVSIVFILNFLIPSQSNGFSASINFSIEALWDTEYATQAFESRYQFPEFRRRPFLREGQKWLFENLHFPFQFSFNLINYSTLFFLFLFLPILTLKITHEEDHGVFVQLLILFSLPIAFAFFGSMNTYDDILQYLLLTIFLILLFDHKYVPAAFFFLMACIARETSLVFIPVIALFLFKDKGQKYLKIGIWLIPLVLYGMFIYNYLDPGAINESKHFLIERRFFAWKNNFSPLDNFRESTTIIFLMTGLPFLLSLRKLSRPLSNRTRFWLKAATGLLILNTIIVIVTGLVREARLLFLPFLIIIPLIISEMEESVHALRNGQVRISFLRESTIIVISLVLAFVWFRPQTHGTGLIYQFYGLIYFIIFFELLSFRKPKNQLISENL